MPIVFVHGVAQRNENAYEGIKVFLERYVAPAVSKRVDGSVRCYSAYWGSLGATFAWNGQSRPRSAITGQGAIDPKIGLPELTGLVGGAKMQPAKSSGGLVGGASESTTADLHGLSRPQRSDLLGNVAIAAKTGTGDESVYDVLDPDLAARIIALDDAAGTTSDSVQSVLEAAALRSSRTLVGQGSQSFIDQLRDRVEETLSRVDDGGFFIASRLLEDLRRPLNDRVTLFLGDVFVYLAHRVVTPPGPDGTPSVAHGSIPAEVLRTIKLAADERTDADEPLVVLSHSMGGQIVYDLVSSLLPMLAAEQPDQYGNLRIDVWGTAASQVGLFEEMKMFLASSPKYSHDSGVKVPFPDRRGLGTWWNVWDRNDFLSYTSAPIFDGVQDEEFISGRSLIDAHGGYLMRPSFFRRFADVISEARARSFDR